MGEKLLDNDGEDMPNTFFKLYKNAENAFDEIDKRLFAFNKRCVPATKNPEVLDISYTIKCRDEIISGIHAEVYTWKILHVNVLFVDGSHRNKGLGSFLLNKVERDAMAFGAKLSHLDTFEFQAKDFYLKKGYEIFGVLDGCPDGFQRFYMKKNLPELC